MIVHPEARLHPGGISMPHYVGQRLLGDAEQGGLQGRGKPGFHLVALELKRCAHRVEPAFSIPRDGRSQAQIIQERRAQIVDQAVCIREHRLGDEFGRMEMLLQSRPARSQTQGAGIEAQHERGQVVAGLVV